MKSIFTYLMYFLFYFIYFYFIYFYLFIFIITCFYVMKENNLQNSNYLATFALVTPMIPVLAYAVYKLALEVWCIAYGLIY
jgi:hypothetical protein